VPIVPIVFATSRRRVLRTWDRFHLALPFGRGLFLWGEPIDVAPNLDDDAIDRTRLLVEIRMNHMVEEADCRVGHGTTVGRHTTSVLRDAPPGHFSG
jgi:lysophospholipid acyltransferase (LPLAT)-like uncharacterized protein